MLFVKSMLLLLFIIKIIPLIKNKDEKIFYWHKNCINLDEYKYFSY